MNPVSLFFSKFAWQIGAISAAALLLVTSGFYVAAQVENHRITELNRALDDRITNPKTGYVVTLERAQANTLTVKTALEGQVADLRKKADEDARLLRETEAALKLAQAETAVTRKKVDALLAFKPKDIDEADAKVLEMLK